MTSEFEPAHKSREIQVLSRPSLSYWQDAMMRLKKNGKAITSLYIVIALLVFTLLGPFIWSIDPSKQNLNFISHGPVWGSKALVIDDEENTSWEGVIREDFPAIPDEPVEELEATKNIEVVDLPSNFRVRLKWEPVKGAMGYVIYRNEVKPENTTQLGVPLGTNFSGNEVSYEDSLNLEPKVYYYSVVATHDEGESLNYKTISVSVQAVIPLSEAILIDEKVQVGHLITLPSHPLGTDHLGRDMLARLIEGARVSLFIGLLAPFLFLIFGTFYGGVAGYIGGNIDNWMMRVADFIVALPFLLFMIIFKVAIGIGPGESGIIPMIVALALLAWPSPARLVRGEILKLREEGFVQASKLLGAQPFYLIIRHMIPNIMGVLFVTFTFSVPMSIFTEAFLSFIGMGVTPPTASWGTMCNEGIKTMLHSPHELIFPALFISLSVFAFNLLGDGLRDAMDARMRSRE